MRFWKIIWNNISLTEALFKIYQWTFCFDMFSFVNHSNMDDWPLRTLQATKRCGHDFLQTQFREVSVWYAYNVSPPIHLKNKCNTTAISRACGIVLVSFHYTERRTLVCNPLRWVCMQSSKKPQQYAAKRRRCCAKVKRRLAEKLSRTGKRHLLHHKGKQVWKNNERSK